MNLFASQYRDWWKVRYGKNSFNDDEEVAALLIKKLDSNSDAMMMTSVSPRLATWVDALFLKTFKSGLLWVSLFFLDHYISQLLKSLSNLHRGR